MIPAIAIIEGPLDAIALRRSAQDPRAGAVVVFEGCARDHSEGGVVERLSYESFVPMALAELEKLRRDALESFDLTQCFIHHRIGDVPLTEAAVVVLCASAHRKESFEAVAWIMDRIKEKVPIWKREAYPQGSPAWVEGEARKGSSSSSEA